MSFLIALDDGHGMNTKGKQSPYILSMNRRIKENEFNRRVVDELNVLLKKCGFQTLLVASTDHDTPLSTRTNRANRAGADAYVSIHYNAYDGTFKGPNPGGIELYVYPGHLNKEAGRLARSIGAALKQGTKQNYRGIKEADFFVLRETSMPAVLTECGFMDHPDEALLMLNPAFHKETAIEHAKGICEYFNMNYKEGKSKEASFKGRRIESIHEGNLRFYAAPSWKDEDVAGYVQKGIGFPSIIDRLSVNGSDQYKVKNSKGSVFYITAHEKYVTVK
ncbi:N-acetylmuramoyl-L-alanine amidase [Halobacillus sp. A5]|uniref:N-acetylmuramoyl-L-alanine amidase family protein n=1 Tax=Halobacillus sp. A5 TaxID=2880263 RepID=UPI0020A674C1|nr:N-acetylmuramoyl-L-alanine amidase [Halobacillus sp. A5]MCP3026888.1 N-acetylmuramoyl-L-alanine amidase [Halobacillus sp. A5]